MTHYLAILTEAWRRKWKRAGASLSTGDISNQSNEEANFKGIITGLYIYIYNVCCGDGEDLGIYSANAQRLFELMFPWFHHITVDSFQPGLASGHRLSRFVLPHRPSLWVLDYNNASVNNMTLMHSFQLTWFLLFDQAQQQKSGLFSFRETYLNRVCAL